VGDRQVDLRLALLRIRQVLQADRVIVDSGGTLNAAVLRQGLVDIVDVVTLPGLVGGRARPRSWTGRLWTTTRGRSGWSFSTVASNTAQSALGTGWSRHSGRVRRRLISPGAARSPPPPGECPLVR
jgi:riboflavin biosynthesis pyrimidine reductase